MLEIKNISKNLDDFNIKDISFSVNKGDYFIILGVSGAGKSIILEIIAGLMEPSSGTIFLNNKNITNEKIQKRKIGLVFQDYAVFPHLSVKENILYPLKKSGLEKKEIQNRLSQLADEMSISHLLNRKPDTLSGGELQRVALARTLALNPECLLLDEPLSSLDIQLKNDLRGLLRRINKKGQTIIHVTHDYEEAIFLANKVAVINDGKIVQIGTPEQVFKNPKTKFVANFSGIKNFFKADIHTVENDNIKKAVINDKVTVNLFTEANSGNGFVIIKNKNIIISNQKPNISAMNNYQGIIADVLPAKFGVEIIVDIGILISVLISADTLEKYNFSEDKNVWISFKASSVKFLHG
ncbi:MAG: ATP-binding cassette domain-containing protein [Bacteroidales bacterium]|nr:ATP-binding cassette domain-containing protein [Bacteroidales bacterium]